MKRNGNGPILGGILAAVAASVCCVVPLVLVSLGIGGAWMSTLTGLEPARPFFIAAALAFFGIGYYRLYRRPAMCTQGENCAQPGVAHRQRTLFWTAALIVLSVIAI